VEIYGTKKAVDSAVQMVKAIVEPGAAGSHGGGRSIGTISTKGGVPSEVTVVVSDDGSATTTSVEQIPTTAPPKVTPTGLHQPTTPSSVSGLHQQAQTDVSGTKNETVRTKPAPTRPSPTSVLSDADSDHRGLLAFLEKHKDCIKGSPRQFCAWLNESEDITSLSLLAEAVSDDDYVKESLQQGNGKTGLKVCFSLSLLECGYSSFLRTTYSRVLLFTPRVHRDSNEKLSKKQR
jgi:hypothetical protein